MDQDRTHAAAGSDFPMTDRAFEPANPNVFDQAKKPAAEDTNRPSQPTGGLSPAPQPGAPPVPSRQPEGKSPEAETLEPFPDDDKLDPFPETARPPKRPITGAIAPGPVGDWIFGDTQHSSLARIMAAFGGAVTAAGKETWMSEETAEHLRKMGVFNDYTGPQSVTKSLNETLLRSGAVLVNGAFYAVPAVFHGLSAAVAEAGEQAEGTTVGHAIGAQKLAREVAAAPEAFPTFEFSGGMPHRPAGEAVRELPAIARNIPSAAAEAARDAAAGLGAVDVRFPRMGQRFPVPEPLREPVDLNVIGPHGEAAWKGLVEGNEPQVTAQTAVTEAAAKAPAPPPDIHAMARSQDPKLFAEFDKLERDRDLFRKWTEDPEAVPPPSVAENLRATEARLSVLQPQVEAAYAKAREGLPEVEPSAGPQLPRDVSRETLPPVSQRLANLRINSSNDVPYGAGADKTDPSLVHIDRHVPTETTIEGVTFDPRQAVARHEIAEHDAMERQGMPYAEAHKGPADAAERAYVEGLARENGKDPAAFWTQYEDQWKGWLSHIEHEKPENPPAGLYTKPYPHQEAEFLRREAAKEPRAQAAISGQPRSEVPPATLVVARKTPDGSIKIGKPGQIHADLMSRAELATDKDTPEIAASMGYAMPNGKFLTRAEALEYARKNEPRRAVWSAQQPEFGLDAATYNEAMQPHVSTPAPPASKPIDAQRAAIIDAVRQDLIAAGRPLEEARAAAQIVAARYEARAARFHGALGTAEELYERESAEIRKMERVANKVRKLAKPASARVLEDFQARMAEAKDIRARERAKGNTGGPGAGVVSHEEQWRSMSAEDRKAMQNAYEDSIEALEPEERAEVKEDLDRHLTEDDLAYLAERAESGEMFQIEAYHGSPHHFERFDTSKIGTGEGAQAYGYGLYFAENEGVAKQYQEQVKDNALIDRNNKRMRQLANEMGANSYGYHNFKDKELGARQVEEYDRLMDEKMKPGQMYKVSLKPDKEDLLDWDKPLSEQSEKVQKAVKKIADVKPLLGNDMRVMDSLLADPKWKGKWDDVGEDRAWYHIREMFPNISEGAMQQIADRVQQHVSLGTVPESVVGERIIRALGIRKSYSIKDENGRFHASNAKTLEEAKAEAGGDAKRVLVVHTPDAAEASKKLAEAGIPGIKYADAGSRFAKTSLTQPQIEARLKILRDDLANAEAQGVGDPARMRQQIDSLEEELRHFKNPTHNFVIFSDKDVEITHRNGEPLTKKERADAIDELEHRPEQGELYQRRTAPPEANLFTEREGEGQTNLPGTERITEAELAKRRAAEPLKPGMAQKPMDVGLFGDEAKQRELFQNQTDTPKFKTWFGDSQVVDDSGKPSVMYHGAPNYEHKGIKLGDFDTFDRLAAPRIIEGRTPGMDQVGNWFSDLPGKNGAQMYAGSQGSIYPVFLKIEHAWEPKDFNEFLAKLHETAGSTIKKAQKKGLPLGRMDPEPLRRWLKDNDYDGIKFPAGEVDGREQTVWVTLEPEQIKSAISNRGAFDPTNPNILEQRALGSLLPREGERPLMKLAKNANASTFIHESGHEWLEQLMKDDAHPLAPEDLKADAKTVRDWLGIESHADLNTGWPGERGQKARAAHEKFARGFEQYLRLGIAPSKELAQVFAKFKAWLIQIYQTLRGLGEPINEDIRAVFDRMISTPEQRAALSAEKEHLPDFHERHEKFAEEAPNERAHAVAENIQEERDSIAKENMLEGEDARLRNIDPETRRRETGSEEPAGSPNGPAGPGQAGAPAQAGVVDTGGGETATASPGVGQEPAGQPAAGKPGEPSSGNANAKFTEPGNPAIDKAGNIRLDKLATPDDVDNVIRAAARNNNDFLEERRGVLSDGETLQLAEALGMDTAWLDRKKIGDAFNVEEIRQGRRLLVQSATDVRDAMTAAKGGDEASLMKLAEAVARHEMIQGKLSGATAEAGRALRAFREVIPGGEQEKNLSDWLKANTGRTLFQLQQMAQLGSNLRSPAQVSNFIFSTANGKLRQAVIFYYVNALISGPITHARYFAGNALTAMWSPLVKTPIAAGLDTAAYHLGLQDERRVFLGEAGAELYALGKGSREGWKAAGEGWRTGNTPHLPGEGTPELFPSQPIAQPIPGVIGTAIGLPGKAVGAIHGFSSAVRYEQEVAKLAYRQAMQEGLRGQAFIDRVADLGNHPTPEMMEAAATVARKDLYMAPTEYDSLAGKLTRAANHNVLTKIIVPFMKIGTQITRNALIEATPLGAFDKKVRANLSGANGIEARNTQAASIIAGTGLMGFMATMTAEGNCTGDGPSDPAKRAVWLLDHHPNSCQIGSVSIPYQGLGSLGVLMRLAANAYETHQGWGEDDGHSVALDYLHGFEKAVLDESFLRGVKDMIDAIYHYEEYGDRYIANMVTNWMPYSVGMGQLARKIDPYQRETRSKSITDMIFKEAQAKIPWVSEGLYPRRDMFGEPIPSAGPVQNYANDPVVKAMDDIHMSVGRLPHKIRGVELTDQQFDDFARIGGRTARMMLERIVKTPSFDKLLPNARADLMHKAITKARAEAEKTVMMHATGSDNDIWKKATENKKVKKGLVPQ